MAVTVTYNTLNAFTDKFYVRKLKDNFYLSSPLLAKLKAREVKTEGGDDIRIPINYTSSSTAKRWGGRADTFDTVLPEHATMAVFPWCYYDTTITIPKTDMLKNMGRSKIVDLLDAETQNAEDSLNDKVGIDLFLTGATSEDAGGKAGVLGLTAALTYNANPTSGAYGGITRVSSSGAKNNPTGNAFWNANSVAANANTSVVFWKGSSAWDNSTVLTLAKMQEMFGLCTAGNIKPNLILTSQVLFNKFWSLLTAIQRQMTDDEMGKIGFQSLSFNGCSVVVDDNINAATSMYFLNMDTFDWRVHPGMNFEATPFNEPINQRVAIKGIFLMCQLVCTRPNRNGVITGLTAA